MAPRTLDYLGLGDTPRTSRATLARPMGLDTLMEGQRVVLHTERRVERDTLGRGDRDATRWTEVRLGGIRLVGAHRLVSNTTSAGSSATSTEFDATRSMLRFSFASARKSTPAVPVSSREVPGYKLALTLSGTPEAGVTPPGSEDKLTRAGAKTPLRSTRRGRRRPHPVRLRPVEHPISSKVSTSEQQQQLAAESQGQRQSQFFNL
jgi:hypothetical protein